MALTFFAMNDGSLQAIGGRTATPRCNHWRATPGLTHKFTSLLSLRPGGSPGIVRGNSFIGKGHLDQDVAGENFALHGAPLAVLDFDLLFSRNHHIVDLVVHTHGGDAVFEVGLDLVLIPGVGMNHEPAAT